MDRSYIVEAQTGERAVVAVVFVNSEPSKGFLADLGLASISGIAEAQPESRQPTEPTMYVCERGAKEVTIKRFDWQGSVVSTLKVSGEPHSIIPPVSGAAADSLIYQPSAHVICGNVRDGTRLVPSVGVLFIKPIPSCDTMKPDMKSLKAMRVFDRITSVEPVATAADIRETSLYVFESSPSASCVSLVKPGPDGSVPADSALVLRGEPHSLIPAISGSAADRFVNPRNALGKSDFPKPPSLPPSRPSSVRPSSFPPQEDAQKAARRNRC